ncbi:MAG: hypothetical protein PVSMB8_12760 [Vulcanimicrobiaceae bacterium]
MIEASAMLAVSGPGVSINVYGSGRVLVADVRGDAVALISLMRHAAPLVRGSRRVSRLLRRAGLRVDVRIARATVARLGA